MKHIKTTMLVMLLLVWAAFSYGQLATNVPGAPGPEVTSSDSAIQAYLAKFTWLKIFIAPAITVLVMGLRKWISAIPIQIWPWVTPFLGAGLDYLGAKMGIWTNDVTAGAAMGALAVWFHQLATQTRELKQQGATPSSQP